MAIILRNLSIFIQTPGLLPTKRKALKEPSVTMRPTMKVFFIEACSPAQKSENQSSTKQSYTKINYSQKSSEKDAVSNHLTI